MSANRVSAREGLEFIIHGLDVIIEMAERPDYYDELAANEILLWQIISRADKALHLMKEQRPVKIERAN